MKTYEERKSRGTGISRLVSLDNKNADEIFRDTLNKRGFIQVRKYIRSAKSTASSTAKSEPSKTATFQPYFSKFCNGKGKAGIERRVGRAIKKLGAGAKNIRLVKQASTLNLALAPVFLNSLYAAYDAREKEEKSLYHKLSLLGGVTAAGISAGSLVAKLSSKIIAARSSGKVLDKLVNRTTKDFKSITNAKPLTKRQILAKRLGSEKGFGEKYFNTVSKKAIGIQEVKSLKKLKTPLTVGGGVIGLGIGGASYGS
jgi:hypothetical protein